MVQARADARDITPSQPSPIKGEGFFVGADQVPETRRKTAPLRRSAATNCDTNVLKINAPFRNNSKRLA
jgi:hypothetical protein